MAEVELRAGAKVDLLGSDEYLEGLEPVARLLRYLLKSERPTVQRITKQLTTDALGDLGGGFAGPGAILYEVPVGFFATVHRIGVTVDGTNPTALSTAGGWGLYRNAPQGDLFALAPTVTGGTVSPVLLQLGTHDSQHLEGGERIVVAGEGLADTTNVLIYVQLRLFETIPPWILAQERQWEREQPWPPVHVR